MSVVGLPDAAVNQSKEHVRAANSNSGFLAPYDKRVTINLAPTDERKTGPGFDLPIPIGLRAATGQITSEHLEGTPWSVSSPWTAVPMCYVLLTSA